MPGFRALTERLPESQRDRRMGQRFPLVPDLEPSSIAGMIESGVQQIGNRLIPNLVSRSGRPRPPVASRSPRRCAAIPSFTASSAASATASRGWPAS